MPTEQPQIKVGQIWQEVDPRHPRFVKVLSVGNQVATIRTVCKSDATGEWVLSPRSREAQALFERFNGARSGYQFIQ